MEQLRLADALGTFTVRTTSPARPIIVAMQGAGHGPTSIARHLNRAGVSTPTGRGRWYPETVKRHVDPGAWNAYMRAYRARMR